VPLGKELDPYTVSLAEADPLYVKKRDSYVADFGDIQIIIGAYGPYVKGPGRRNNAKVPADVDPKTLTREDVEKILAEKPKSARRPVKRRKKVTKKTK
jgi:topoisomerase IA-like protein